MPRTRDLARIDDALDHAAEILRPFVACGFDVDRKSGGDPVTEADLAVDSALRARLPMDGDGWLSEETADDPARLGCSRVWIVDPIDGTKEFVAGIPEWCVSIGLVENGQPIAGGIYNPLAEHRILGAVGHGVTLNGTPARVVDTQELAGARVLASRSELKRGEWERFRDAPFEVEATGSVAYKLGLVAVGLADATWTLVPKSEWDIAAGAALVRAGGGDVYLPDWSAPVFNQPRPKVPGFIALPPGLSDGMRALLEST